VRGESPLGNIHHSKVNLNLLKMNRLAFFVLGIFLLTGARSLRAQQINPRVPPPPPPAEASAPAQPAATPPASGSPPTSTPSHPIDPTLPPPPPSADEPETPAAPAGPVFDPLHAQRSMDVGTFYLNKGSYDAAIDRFIEAANYQPTLAIPWKLLGQAYEKKREWAKAADSYNKYLEKMPRAADAAKIRKQVTELQEKAAQDSPKKAER
jgi:tetratricopeptide (TPR) repeat protein